MKQIYIQQTEQTIEEIFISVEYHGLWYEVVIDDEWYQFQFLIKYKITENTVKIRMGWVDENQETITMEIKSYDEIKIPKTKKEKIEFCVNQIDVENQLQLLLKEI